MKLVFLICFAIIILGTNQQVDRRCSPNNPPNRNAQHVQDFVSRHVCTTCRSANDAAVFSAGRPGAAGIPANTVFQEFPDPVDFDSRRNLCIGDHVQTWQCPRIPPFIGNFVCHDCTVCQPIFGGPNGRIGNYGHLDVNLTLESCLPVACPRRLPINPNEPESLNGSRGEGREYGGRDGGYGRGGGGYRGGEGGGGYGGQSGTFGGRGGGGW